MRFSYGIEHEVAFLNGEGRFADFSNTQFSEFDRIIQALPTFPGDYPQLRVGDAGIKVKRWYIEGFERFADSEDVVDCAPKGIEIRTTIHPTIAGAIAELSESFELLCQVAAASGFKPVWTSFNPFQTTFEPDPPLNPYELRRRETSPEMQTAEIPMLTYGPDLSISADGLVLDRQIDIGRKLTYYSPALLPFSFSSPFFDGKLWDGYSVRTYVRTGPRPACMVFIDDPARMIESYPSLTQMARVPAETGRIEFKAFDSCADFSLYAGLLVLLKGLVLDETLPGRATVPDAALHQQAARAGFDDPQVLESAHRVMEAAAAALLDDDDRRFLAPLHGLLESRRTPAHQLIDAFKVSGSIEKALRQPYETRESSHDLYR
ncbi:MAG: glutamate--cysteine ligase [Chloroflexota bacterium]|nr:glutamate--cysteine ligase [Chloroflexota bacterium]